MTGSCAEVARRPRRTATNHVSRSPMVHHPNASCDGNSLSECRKIDSAIGNVENGWSRKPPLDGLDPVVGRALGAALQHGPPPLRDDRAAVDAVIDDDDA